MNWRNKIIVSNFTDIFSKKKRKYQFKLQNSPVDFKPVLSSLSADESLVIGDISALQF